MIEQIVEQGLVDIMLMSAHTNEILTHPETHLRPQPPSRPPPGPTTPPISTSCAAAGSPTQPALPFRTATLDHIQCGHLDCPPDERQHGANLGLYSITFEQQRRLDREALERVQGVSPRGRTQGVSPFPGSLRSESARSGRGEQDAGVHQRRHRPHARRRHREGPADLPQDGLPRPQGDGGAGPLRSAPRRRHPRRLGRHHL